MRQFTSRFIGALAVILVSPSSYASVQAKRAVVKAVNKLREADSAISLNHPGHEMTWTRESVRFKARGGPSWEWKLGDVRRGNAKIRLARDVAPSADRDRLRVDYRRGAIVERYLCGVKSVEQQFVLPDPLAGDGDLVIDGNVRSSGRFSRARHGWLWSDGRSVVSLGQVTVFDANGATLPARMNVTHDRVRIIVEGPALAHAAYPVTIDPEIGTQDFRISNMPPAGSALGQAVQPAIAYNSTNDLFLVVWAGTDGTQYEIWGQLIDRQTGAEIGSDFRISDMGSVEDSTYNASEPDVAYNASNNEFLVVWRGDDNTPPLVNDEQEIFGQRLAGATGATVGTNDFRISFMGPNGSTTYGAYSPSLAWDSINNRYLVAWQGNDNVVAPGETEVFGRVINSIGTSFSANDTRFSNVGPDGDTARFGFAVDVAFDSVNGQYLVVWSGDHAANDAFDIYGQLVTSAGVEMGVDFGISDMGNSDSNANYRADAPAVAFNPNAGEYLVVWRGDDEVTGIDDALEIFGQLVSAAGAPTGTNDFLISDMGPAATEAFDADSPNVSFSAATNEYLVVWNGDDTIDNEIEIYCQRLKADGTAVGTNDNRLSHMGPDGNANYDGYEPAVAWGNGLYLIVWRGDDNTGPLVDEEWEIFGQLFTVPSAALSTITANPTSIPSDGVATSTITVQAKDSAGNNLTTSAGAVVLMTTAGALGSVTNNSDGTYTATLTASATPGTATVSGTLAGSAITDTADVVFEFGPPTNLSATATSTSEVSLTWSVVNTATSYDIYRATAIPGYAFVGSTSNTTYPDSGLTANQTYVYLVRALKTGETSGFSSPDVATTMIFTDPVLNSSITVKAAHINELRTAVNAMRVAAALGAAGFTDNPVVGLTTLIKGAHINELRTALNTARAALGLPAIIYTDNTLTTSVTTVKAAHVSQLRGGTQ